MRLPAPSLAMLDGKENLGTPPVTPASPANRLTTADVDGGPVGILVGVTVGVAVVVGLAVGVALPVGVAVVVGLAVGVALATAVAVAVGATVLPSLKETSPPPQALIRPMVANAPTAKLRTK